ncbi:Putative white-brown complex homolog protein 30 [Seminavis robusta]|uniref:White-brown complex homolog protein 30 n=1 Tax=Seminavis robusta TaxID=568900 RepID=A0A9N8EAE4_9STRA|nr:Putative white-brown complex homolog protein 30 [Seminavis robusta]|eukprot:Sro673_g185260.1 Putative white-brown complex homolog protein 30 (972) ;mRNA; r:34311-37389
MNTQKNNQKPTIDPFAHRPGHTLTWENLEMQVKSKKNGEDTTILRKVSGEANPGELCCIIGQSGSGKTSLLQYLAGRAEPSRQVQIKGNIYLDGKVVDPRSQKLQSKVAYTEQHDTLLATATPREAIYFSARLRLPRSIRDREIEELTNKILKQLRLSKVADSLIGGEHFRGLSGGEMRRVSLGVQLVVCPSIVFLDEVTSGLDSRNAATVMQICKDVAQAGASILVVLHQPSSEIFSLMDKLILLERGRCMYRGKASKAVEYFASMGPGFELPNQYNPAEWLLKVALEESEKVPGESVFFSKDLHFEEESSMMTSDAGRTEASASTAASITEVAATATMSTQLSQQLQRDVRTLHRDGNGMLMRFGMILGSSALSAITFTGVGKDSLQNPASFSSHVGAIFFLLLGTTLILQLTLFDFIGVRDLYIKEIRTNHYNMFTFGLTKFGLDLCLILLQAALVVLITYWALALNIRLWYFIMIMFALTMVNVSMSYLLGSLPKDPRIAKEFIALIILPQLLFSGFFVNPDSLPVWISWLTYLMPTTYAFRLFLADEFSQCVDFSPVERQLVNCIQALVNTEQTDLGGVALFSQEHVESIATDDFTITVAETGEFGKYTGAVEYLGLISPAEDSFVLSEPCEVAGTRALFFYPSPEENQCSFVYTALQQASLNQKYRRDEYNDESYGHFFLGSKFSFTYADDLQSTWVSRLDVFTPQALYEDFIEPQVDPTKVSSEICQTMQNFCPSTWENNGFAAQDDCISKMSQLPTTTVNSRGQTVLDGNSTGCRTLHTALVLKDRNHCSHLSFIPEEDPNGNTKCSESYNRHADDLFTPEVYAKFMMAAEDLGFNATDINGAIRTVKEKETCRQPTDPIEEASFRHLPLPTNYFCAQYLQSQDAAGSNDTVYWIVLVSMLVFLRFASLVALKSRAFNQMPGADVFHQCCAPKEGKDEGQDMARVVEEIATVEHERALETAEV